MGNLLPHSVKAASSVCAVLRTIKISLGYRTVPREIRSTLSRAYIHIS